MKIVGMIPCRMNSKRFKGKAIYPILDKPMIYWVYKQALKVKELDEIYIVTSDIEIKDVCEKYKIPCICNKREGTTAAQKIAIEANKIDADIFINIQGDEPLVEPNCIKQIIMAMKEDQSLAYVGLKSQIKTLEEFNDPNVVKAVTDENGYAMYFSRSPIPYEFNPNNAYRVMGLYGYRKSCLEQFESSNIGILENLEHGIEMLRLMNFGFKIKLLDTSYNSIGVDLKEHVKKVEKIMVDSLKYGEYTDLYDENKKKTRKKLFRAKGTKLEVPNGYYNIVVVIFIENSNEEILLQKTPLSKGNVWALPGGHVKSGETSKEAIINELEEEMNLKINDVKLFKTYKYESAFKDVYYIKKDVDISKIKLDSNEVDSISFIKKSEIKDMIKNNLIRKTNIDAIYDYLNINNDDIKS